MAETIGKTALAEEIAAVDGDFTQARAKIAVEAVLASIARVLQRGDTVAFKGFGSFNVKQRAARKGRNPQTGEEVNVAARNAVTFSASSSLKELVNAPPKKKGRK